MTRRVLVDFSHYDDLCGFGEIARNYAPRLAARKVDGIRFIFVLPEKRVGLFGEQVDYIVRERKKQEASQYPYAIDLWHATDQQYNFRLCRPGMLQLLTVHDLNFMREKHGLHKLRHILQLRHRVSHSDYVTTISEYARQDLLAHVPYDASRVQVIYNGIAEVEHIVPQQPAFIADASKPFFFTIGQIREKKNFQTLVPMMQFFPNHHLYICGDDHFAYADTLRQLIATQGEGRVSLTGKITNEEKSWLYQHCAAFLFPSRLEGFGIPVLEAMRLGAKVFSSRMSSLPEVCGPHADYWDDYAPHAMADVVEKGLKEWSRDSAEAQAAAAYGRSFNYDTYTDAYVALYRKLLGL